MLILEKRYFPFKVKEVWFADQPFDVEGYHGVLFHACRNKLDAPGFSREEFTTSIIDLSQDLDTLWKGLDKSACRYAIKRARRDGIVVRINQDYEEFLQTYRSLKKMKGLAKFKDVSLTTLQRYGTLFAAQYEGEIVGGHVYLEDESNIRLWLSASRRFEVDRKKATLVGNANRLLHWEAMEYARKKGIKNMDMGGLWSDLPKNDPRYAINFFKLSFGGAVITLYDYQKDYSPLLKLIRYLFHQLYLKPRRQSLKKKRQTM